MASDIRDLISAMLAPVRTRVANMVSRAVVTLVDDTQKMQLIQLKLMGDEVRAKVERFQNYGFTSVPKADGKAEAAVAFVGGRRDHGLVIAVDDRRYRLTGLSEGEVAIYTDEGDKIHIKRGGHIEITGSSEIKLNGGGTAGTPVAKEGSATSGHVHQLTGATAGPYPVVGSTMSQTDTIASGAGSPHVKVP